MSQEDLDLVIHTGDYIYEYDSNSYTSTGGNVRANSNHEIVNLQDYRERHAQYKTDPDLQAAHAAFPWLVTFDDHEIDNNWAADIPEEGMPMDIFVRRRKAAFKAYWEHMPLRTATRPSGNAIQIFRRAVYGNSDTSNAGRLTENPWIKFNNQQRGYVRVTLDQNLCKTDYRVLPYVKRPGAPISTKKSFVVEAGNPGLKATAAARRSRSTSTSTTPTPTASPPRS